MPIGQGSLGPIDRVGIKKVYYIAADRVPDQSLYVLGREFHSTQAFELFLTEVPFGPAAVVTPGNQPTEDQPTLQALGKYTPVVYGKKWSLGLQMLYTDQYNLLKNLQPRVKDAFAHTRNIAAASIDSNGFAAGNGPVSTEPLYSTSHAATVGSGSNRPSPDITYGPLGILQAKKELRAQQDGKGMPLFFQGPYVITVPISLWQEDEVIKASERLPGTNWNDRNIANNGTTRHVVDYYPPNSTAWFVRHEENHGKFMLNQMPYEVFALTMQTNLYYPWLAVESYVPGWNRWQGSWGTAGA